jgi:hypothetical protein
LLWWGRAGDGPGGASRTGNAAVTGHGPPDFLVGGASAWPHFVTVFCGRDRQWTDRLAMHCPQVAQQHQEAAGGDQRPQSQQGSVGLAVVQVAEQVGRQQPEADGDALVLL